MNNKPEQTKLRIYDYQMYIQNEIRNLENPILPPIATFERPNPKPFEPIEEPIHIPES